MTTRLPAYSTNPWLHLAETDTNQHAHTYTNTPAAVRNLQPPLFPTTTTVSRCSKVFQLAFRFLFWGRACFSQSRNEQSTAVAFMRVLLPHTRKRWRRSVQQRLSSGPRGERGMSLLGLRFTLRFSSALNFFPGRKLPHPASKTNLTPGILVPKKRPVLFTWAL